MNAHIYEQITDRIITLLTQGTVPWQKPWKARTGLPRNLVSQKSYSGINVFLLLAMSYESPFWLTFRQASSLGGSIRKGEKSCPVVFWKQTTIADKESGEPQKIPLLRYYSVFNVAQCDGLKIGIEPVAEAINGIVHPDEIVENGPEASFALLILHRRGLLRLNGLFEIGYLLLQIDIIGHQRQSSIGIL